VLPAAGHLIGGFFLIFDAVLRVFSMRRDCAADSIFHPSHAKINRFDVDRFLPSPGLLGEGI
jgi:hypothetical protein